jgi:hypothetical protein
LGKKCEFPVFREGVPENWMVPFMGGRGIMDATADCNTLTDVFGQHFNKNFRLHHIFLQEITRNTNKTMLKYQNG